MRYLSVNADAKTVKGVKHGYLTGVLYLSPHESGQTGVNVCPFADKCIASCLNTAGRGGFNTTQSARRRKTQEMVSDRKAFEEALAKDIEALVRKAKREGLTPCVRVNGTSDLHKMALRLAERFPTVQFYDYTKNPHALDRPLRFNYHLTFSADGMANELECVTALLKGFNVAVVFDTRKGEALPDTMWGVRVIDGDESDLRFLDPQGVVVGLRAKGKARKDTSGFVVATQGV